MSEYIMVKDLFPQGIKKIYLAAPFFTPDEIKVYRAVVNLLRVNGYQVFVPQEHEIPNGENMPNEVWGAEVYKADVAALLDADAVMVLNWGMYSDSGTAWEQGYAYGSGKFVVTVLISPWARSIDQVSLMMANGCHVQVRLPQLIDVEDFNNHWVIWEQK